MPAWQSVHSVEAPPPPPCFETELIPPISPASHLKIVDFPSWLVTYKIRIPESTSIPEALSLTLRLFPCAVVVVLLASAHRVSCTRLTSHDVVSPYVPPALLAQP